MTSANTRRQFFKQCAASAACAGGLAATVPAAWTSAIEPVKRNGKPRFKFSLAAYSYRSLLQGQSASLTLSDFIDDCAQMNLEATELTSYYFPDPTTPEYLRQLKQQCFLLGLDVSGTAIRNDFGYKDPAKQKQEIDHVKKWIEYAEILGAPVIRIFAGKVKEDTTPQENHRLMVSAMEECCDYAGQHGVYLALENHGGPTATPAGLLALVHDVQSPWFGVNFDSGNFRTEDPYGDLAKIAPYAINAQIKVVMGKREQPEPANFKRLAQILRDADYRGYVVLEYEEKGNPREECPKFVDRLREAFA